MRSMTPKLVLLAGGKGKRMGGNKPFSPYGASTLIETTLARLKTQVREVVINAGEKGSALTLPLSCLGARLIFDDPRLASRGPLSGVLSALDMARADGATAVLTAPCDMPSLPADMVMQLLDAPAAEVVHFSGERDYPLCALWQVSIADNLRAALEATEDGLAVMKFLATRQVHKITVTEDAAFVNINQPSPR